MAVTPRAEAEALEAQGQLEAAGEAYLRAGDHAAASAVYERACVFDRAAETALSAGEPRRAAAMAVLAGDAAEALLAAVVDAVDGEALTAVAHDLDGRGHPRHAGAMFLEAGDAAAAALCFERGGASLQAAEAHEAAGDPAAAARVLEGALASGMAADPDALRVAVGTLYERHGKHRPAVRALQAIGPGHPLRGEVLGALSRSLSALGLDAARRALEPELATLGVTAAAPSSPPSGEAGGVLFGRFERVREIARTPHARLVEARDRLSGRRVALKLLAAAHAGTGRDALERFAREARALDRLRHPHVVTLEGYMPEGPAMALEWMDGGSLADLLARGPISPARAAEVARAVLAALAEAHRLGILHRDIKPSNVLFDGGGNPKLADFGAAHLAASGATVTAGAIGTLAYMSPEQRRGEPATVASDLFGVGALLREMLTGDASSAALAPSGVHPDLHAGHDALVACLVDPEPAERFASALAARDACDALVWSTRVVEAAASQTAPAPLESTATAGRLAPSSAGSSVRLDRWLGREVRIVPGGDGRLALAGAMARAEHPSLARVYRVDPADHAVWVETPTEPAGALTPSDLSPDDRQALREALAALHAQGAVHGAVGPAHLFRRGGRVVLAFPADGPLEAAPEADLDALARM